MELYIYISLGIDYQGSHQDVKFGGGGAQFPDPTENKIPRSPWRSAWPFDRWNQHSFMDAGNVAEVAYLQRDVYRYF